MRLEYLISSENKEKCLNILDELSPKEKKINDNQYIVMVEIDSESEETAKRLSDFNDGVMKFGPTVLANGSAAYFNKTLFPIINDFERNLRKLLYAASAIKSDAGNASNACDNINSLEYKDFGEIFDMLFLDREYWKRVKTFVNSSKGTGWNGYAKELQRYLDEEKEDILWDRLLPGQCTLLRENFSEIRVMRNDVMHAHNINKGIFNQTRNLFRKVNTELELTIEELADGVLIPDTYNQELDTAVRYLVTESGDYLTDSDGNKLILG